MIISKIKFITDSMLGSFTRWLRMLGYDVKYMEDASDIHFIRIARKENRILLTNDKELYNRAKNMRLESYMITGKSEPERLASLAKEININLDIDTRTSRCPICNSILIPVNKSKIGDKAPSTTLSVYDKFWKCEGCEKIYWKGGHWKRIEDTLTKAKRLLNTIEHQLP
jgi:uncharacterized protein with PIN domain